MKNTNTSLTEIEKALDIFKKEVLPYYDIIVEKQPIQNAYLYDLKRCTKETDLIRFTLKYFNDELTIFILDLSTENTYNTSFLELYNVYDLCLYNSIKLGMEYNFNDFMMIYKEKLKPYLIAESKLKGKNKMKKEEILKHLKQHLIVKYKVVPMKDNISGDYYFIFLESEFKWGVEMVFTIFDSYIVAYGTLDKEFEINTNDDIVKFSVELANFINTGNRI
ncbi:MAG: hypothetical protein Q8L90_07080 [Bacteroidota bacterium]|nr:hypothetical protein [Bacteroidota bacterium]